MYKTAYNSGADCLERYEDTQTESTHAVFRVQDQLRLCMSDPSHDHAMIEGVPTANTCTPTCTKENRIDRGTPCVHRMFPLSRGK